jgi:hypothetical protein
VFLPNKVLATLGLPGRGLLTTFHDDFILFVFLYLKPGKLHAYAKELNYFGVEIIMFVPSCISRVFFREWRMQREKLDFLVAFSEKLCDVDSSSTEMQRLERIFIKWLEWNRGERRNESIANNCWERQEAVVFLIEFMKK